MPNTGQKQQGKSLKQRLNTAAQMTAAQTRERSAARQSSGRPSRTRDGSQSTGRAPRSESVDRRTSQRSSRSRSSSRGNDKLAASHSKTSRHSEESASARRQRERYFSRNAAPQSAGAKLKALPSSAGGAVAGALQTVNSKVSDFVGTYVLSDKRRAVVLIALVLILVIGCILYGPGRTYYQSLRNEQRIEAVAKAYSDRNEAIKKQNEALKTQEGVENAAREDYGWVKEGENAVSITNAGGLSTSTSKLPAQINEDSIEAPHTWYYDILDVVFFVSYDK